MRKNYKFILGLGTILFCLQANAQVTKIGTGLSYPTGVSDNGIVVMNSGNTIFKWDADNGMVQIGAITNGFDFGGQTLISQDGKKITAGITNPTTNLNQISLYDVDSQTWTYLGGIDTQGSDGELSSSWGMSADGTAIVGLGWTSAANGHAIKWDAINGIVDLGISTPNSSSRANAINDDKTVVVGWRDLDGPWVGVKWTNAVVEYILDNDGNNVGEALGVSADGKTIIGNNGFNPYVWNENTGYQQIEHPNAGMWFRGGATGISADGKTVIGYFRPWPAPPMSGEGFIWTEETGRINLNEYVESLGYDTHGITFGLPLSISRDGTKIVGTGETDNELAIFLIDLTDALSVNNQASKAHVKLYPNPASETINISGLNNISHIEIFNVAGQKVSSIKEKTSSANVQHLPQGTYILKVTANGKTTSYKFIKK